MDASAQTRFEDRTYSRNLRLARSLGLFSLGLGAAQLAAPSSVARAIGIDDGEGNTRWIRAVGVREIGVGLGLLWSVEPAALLWSRVAGDVIDLSMLLRALGDRDGDEERRRRIARAMIGVAAVAVPDIVGSVRTSGSMNGTTTAPPHREADAVHASLTIRRSPQELYAFWRDLTRLPQFMTHLHDVTVVGERRTRWRAAGRGTTVVEWEADTIEDVPDERIAWRSVEGSQVENAGSVRFRPAPRNRGTEVLVRLSYAPPGGVVGRVGAKLLGEEPRQQVTNDLRRFKQLMEAGEIARSDARPEGTRTMRPVAQRPGRPIAA